MALAEVKVRITEPNRPLEELLEIAPDFDNLAKIVSKSIVDETEIPSQALDIAKRLITQHHLTPSELTTLIFEHPHSVQGKSSELNPVNIIPIEPKDEERDIAATPINFERIKNENTRALVQAAALGLNSYIRMRYLKDSFEIPEERKEWERKTLSILEVLDNQNPDISMQKQDGYVETFKRAWDNNRYTKNARTKIFTAFGLLSSVLNDPTRRSELMEISMGAQSRLRSIIATGEMLENTPNLEKTEAYEITKVGTVVTLETLSILIEELNRVPA